MLIVENIRIRPNINGSVNDLIGWSEFVISNGEEKLYINNVKIKLVEGESVIRLEFPSKPITDSSGVERKVFFVKPINSITYEIILKAHINWLKTNKGK